MKATTKAINALMKFSLKIFFLIFGLDKSIKDSNSKRIIKMYEKSGFASFFTKIRFWDAPFKEISKMVPKKGTIVDLGCGDGILVNYLAIESSKRKLVGIEKNRDRIKEAGKGFKNAKFVRGDVLTQKFPNADCILIVHVLHHLFSKDQQLILLNSVSKKLKRNGKLIVAEVIERPLAKYVFSWLTDAFTVPILFEKKLFDFNFHYRSMNEWVRLLEENGFLVEAIPAHKGMPFSHAIFKCTKI